MKECEFCGSTRGVRGGLCGGHRYQQKMGRELTPLRFVYDKSLSVEEKLQQGSLDRADGCRIWFRGLNAYGYGQINVGGGVTRKAHVVAYELAHGPVPDGMMVRHTCDNRACVRVDHLVVGTHSDNMRDMVERGRSPLGSKNPMSKLTEEQASEVLMLRAGGMLQREIAERFGVTQSLISMICSGRVRSYLRR